MVIGIDLSLTGTGVVIINEKGEHIEQLIRSKPPKSKNPTTEIMRIMKIRDEISFGEEKIALAAIEGISFMSRNTTSTSQLSGLNYMVREKLFNANIPFVIIAPSSLKKFVTGKGNCGKDIMMLETYKRWGVSITNDNIADAYCLAKVAEALINDKIELIIPQKEVLSVIRPQIL